MNAHSPTVADEALALAATNADILRAVRDGEHNAPGEIGHACGRPTKNMARDVGVLIREGLVVKAEGAPYRVTDAGAAALNGVDLAQGRIAGLTADPEAGLLLRHDQMRPNPLQPRKHFDAQEMEELKASIAADLAAGGPGVLQNLVVFPADADGVHLISAGDRRWRAVGELIAEGVWRDGKRLRAIERENSPGQVAFIALVENGQRANLTMMERARAYAEMAAETGLSARQCALQTGCDPRTVQEMLKVVREADPEDIAAHEAGERTWEWLRDTVKEHREPEAEPAQGNLEESSLPYTLDDHARSRLTYHAAACAKLKPRGLMMLVELADKVLRDPMRGRERHTLVANEHSGVDSDFILAGAGFSWEGGYGIASIAASTLEWLRTQNLLTVTGDRDAILRSVRTKAGIAADKVEAAETLIRYITPWLDPSWTPAAPNTARSTADPIVGGSSSTQPPKPIPQADPPDATLDHLERLSLLELAFKVAAEGDEGGWVKVRNYWLDKTASDLASRRFIVWHHGQAGGPHGGLTNAGKAWIEANGGVPINKGMLTVLRQKAGVSREGDDYATPWLNHAGALEAFIPEPAADPAPLSDLDRQQPDEDEEATAAAERVLDQVKEEIATDGAFPELAEAAGLSLPLSIGAEGGILDAKGWEIATVDVNGELPDALATAIGFLLVTAFNAAAEAEIQEQPEEPVAGRERPEPAVPIRRSITPDYIVCLEDGRKFKSLKRHLRTRYNLSPEEYRERWGLPHDYPMLAPNYAKARYELARSIGLPAASKA